MGQIRFKIGDIVKERKRHVQMKIIDILPAKTSSFTLAEKYVCEWQERANIMTRICDGNDIQYLSSTDAMHTKISKNNSYNKAAR